MNNAETSDVLKTFSVNQE